MSIDPFDFSREGFEKRQSIVESASYRSRKEGLEAEQARRDETTRLGAVRKRPLGQGVTKFEKWDGTQWIEISQREYQIYETPLTSRKAAVERAQASYEKNKEGDGQDTEPPEVVKKPDYVLGTKSGAFKNSSLGKFQPLRYPKERTDNNQDYIQFSVIKYQRSGLTGGPVGSNINVEGNLNNQLLQNLLGSVTLPIPSQISDTNTVNYASGQMNFMTRDILPIADNLIGGDPSGAFDALNNLGESLVRNKEAVTKYFAQQAIQSLGLNITLDQLLVRSNGAIINPNMELLFTSPNLRTFTFAFKFTPRFREEGEEVKEIIRTFKKYSSPKGAGDYLKAPDIFQIRYLGKGGGNHKFLNRFKLCALTQMSVNYTADGVYATYDNETPVSMIMTLNFQELTPVYAEDYEGTLGVGY